MSSGSVMNVLGVMVMFTAILSCSSGLYSCLLSFPLDSPSSLVCAFVMNILESKWMADWGV